MAAMEDVMGNVMRNAHAKTQLANASSAFASMLHEAVQDSSDGGFSSEGDPLQPEGPDANKEAIMASHVKDMLVIYERVPDETEREREVEERMKSQGPFQKRIRKSLKTGRFDCFVCLLIVVDSIMITISVNYSEQEVEEDLPMIGVLYAISFCFFVEYCIRVTAEPWKFTQKLLLFDLVVVLISALELISRFIIQMQMDTLFLRIFRICRLMRFAKLAKPARRLPPLQLLLDALARSVQPLVIVLLLSGILIFAFAVMMTNLVPEALKDHDDDVREVVLKQYGTVLRSMRTFLEVIDGSASCSIDSMMVLVKAAGAGRQGVWFLVTCRLLATFVLFLALSGLVTGVFIEQLCGATNRVEEKIRQKELHKSHDCLLMLDSVFKRRGYSGDDPVTFKEVSKILSSDKTLQDRLEITTEDARRLFMHLDVDGHGSVGTDDIIFGVFKLKTISKSMDMFSIDYQQEKALQRLSDLHSTLRLSIAGIQSRLASFAGLLPAMEKKIDMVTGGITEIQKLEEDLVVARKTRHSAYQEVTGRGPGDLMSNVLNIETLRSNYHLNGRLTALEEDFEKLQESEDRGAPTPQEKEEAVAMIADSIVQSIKQTLEEEIIALRNGPGGLRPSELGSRA